MAHSSGGGGGRAEAERWLEIAGRLLAARDLVGSKRFAERAMEADPLLDGVDQVLAVADVLLASQRRVGPHYVDWYAVLSVDSTSDAAAIKGQYRRLGQLLQPDRNPHAGAEQAARYVSDAFSFLSDPSKKSLLDSELKKQQNQQQSSNSQNTPSPKPPSSSRNKRKSNTYNKNNNNNNNDNDNDNDNNKNSNNNKNNNNNNKSFWTACPFCCHLHEYASMYRDKSLQCPNESCRRAFNASEIPVPPPMVPGTDLYYCAWGFFPLGFPKPSDLNNDWKPFHPVFPWNPNQDQNQNQNPTQLNGLGESSNSKLPVTRGKKTMARKKVGAGPKRKLSSNNSSGEEIRGININEEAKGLDGTGQFGTGEEDMVNFNIDVDSTDELLGNLQNLPFLREEVIPGRMM